MTGPGISHPFDDFTSPKFINCWNLPSFTEYNEQFNAFEDFNVVQVTTFFQAYAKLFTFLWLRGRATP